jgi:zinc transport system permease protein
MDAAPAGLGLLLDPLFRLPLAAGLLLALVLPVLGTLALLRDEWLAALGLAHLGAAGALVGLAVGLPGVLGAGLAALLGVATKALLRGSGNLTYAVMMLLGWSVLTLVAANSHLGEALGHALVDGQLYFAGPAEVGAALGLAVLAGLTLPWLAPRLLRARLFPRHDRANRLPAWRWHLGFDALLAFGVATGSATLGLMGAFALVLIPAWVAFRLAPNWGWALGGAALIGLGASAISSLPQGYAQNAATTPAYRQAIAAGSFATARGLALTQEDRLRRDLTADSHVIHGVRMHRPQQFTIDLLVEDQCPDHLDTAAG